MFARVLVPTDFSVASDAALEYAVMFTRTFVGSLHLLHVASDAGTPGHAHGDGRTQTTFGHMQDRLTRTGTPTDVTTKIVEGPDPALAIVEHARSMDAELIAMGTHGRSGMSHLLMGSVAERVVRTSPCPVLTLREPARVVGVHRILVPTDFSAPSDAALDCARLIALRFDASVHLLHVIDVEQMERRFGLDVFVDTPDSRAARLRDARERLAHRIFAYERENSRVTTEVVFGPAARTAAQCARDNGFDLIVMGTHGRAGIARVMLGSVSEHVVRHAACPVITTHDLGASGRDVVREATRPAFDAAALRLRTGEA